MLCDSLPDPCQGGRPKCTAQSVVGEERCNLLDHRPGGLLPGL